MSSPSPSTSEFDSCLTDSRLSRQLSRSEISSAVSVVNKLEGCTSAHFSLQVSCIPKVLQSHSFHVTKSLFSHNYVVLPCFISVISTEVVLYIVNLTEQYVYLNQIYTVYKHTHTHSINV